MLPRDMLRRVERASAQDPLPARHSTPPIDPGQAAPGSSADRDREAFLDILSHELRTPVTTIYGGAQLLTSQTLEPERRRALAADVSDEADRLYRLVEDLVVLARSERGGIRPVGEPVAVGRLVIAAVERATERSPGIEIRFLGTRDAAAEEADEVLVNHVIRNLLDNAIRYGAAAGPIEVVVSETESDVVVRFIDGGEAPTTGIDPFALSARMPVTAAGRAGGGVALYVADLLVDALHGRMWAVPARPYGAEFGFALARAGEVRPAEA